MSEFEAIKKSIQMNQNLYKAYDYIIESIHSDVDIQSALVNMIEALKSIVSNTSTLMSDKNRAQIYQSSRNLQHECEMLTKSKQSVISFSNAFATWEEAVIECIYTKVLTMPVTLDHSENEGVTEILEIILSRPTNYIIESLTEFLLSQKYMYKSPRKSYELAIQAFEKNNNLCSYVFDSSSPRYHYIYKKVNEVTFEICPICHETGYPYLCKLSIFAPNFTNIFSPAKLWMKCSKCGDLFTYNFPKDLLYPNSKENDLGDESYTSPRIQNLPVLGHILERISAHANGTKLLDVGAGMGELIAVALELGFDTEGIEISERQSQKIRSSLGVVIYCTDFLEFHVQKSYNIIIMGNIIEHLANPKAAIKKAYELLEEDGVLWLSTPNYHSGYSRLMKYDNALLLEPWHITYFSYEGLKKLLHDNGFLIKSYEMSSRYNGSMEILAVKTSKV